MSDPRPVAPPRIRADESTRVAAAAAGRARDGRTAADPVSPERLPPVRMKSVKVIDVTLRDGQQSLWATRMTNGMFLPYVHRMDEMGFDWIDLVGGAVFDVCVRYLREDPWQRMRLAAERVTKTPLNVWTRGQSLFTFEFFPDDIVELTIRRCAANGMARYTCYDALNDVRNIELSIRVARESGMFASGHLVYTVSPVHTDEYYRGVARAIAGLGVDSVGIKDPSGLLTPERARTLVPAVRSAIGGLPLEMHTHCRSGLGELVCLESVPLGVDIVHTGIRPLACGDALPDGRYVVERLKEAGYGIRLDDRDLEEMEEYFTGVALRYDKPMGKPLRYDPFLYHHQVPGGMISNLRSQLRDMDMEDCLEAVLEEAGQVREDLGYPILVSPFAQFVITQAVINVVQKERYATIPDEVARYVFGHYGTPPGPISPRVLDRAAAIGKDHEPMTDRPGALVPPWIERLRKERGPFESDDDLLLHAFYQPSQLEPLMRERDLPERTGAVPWPADISVKKVLEEIRRLPGQGSISIRRSGLVVDGYR